jgi:G3E family GTPase
MSDKKIPVNLLTGFLGSGKTTLLKALLRENNGRRKIAIVMNEIGEISIDAKLLEGFSVDVFELNDGCICCSVNDDFVSTLDALAEKISPDLIVIETTGVANPMSIIYSLLNPMFVLDAVITTVDAKNFLRMLPEIDVAEEQADAADAVVITKDDLAEAGEIDAVREWLAAHCPRARVFMRSAIQLETIFGVAYPRMAAEMHLAQRDSAHRHLEGLETFRIRLEGAFMLDKLQSSLDGLPPSVWRVKGVVHMSERPESFILNFAFGRYTIEDYVGRADAGCDLIVIGNFSAAERASIASIFEASLNIS